MLGEIWVGGGRAAQPSAAGDFQAGDREVDIVSLATDVASAALGDLELTEVGAGYCRFLADRAGIGERQAIGSDSQQRVKVPRFWRAARIAEPRSKPARASCLRVKKSIAVSLRTGSG
mgnify:CR=1 FL=1